MPWRLQLHHRIVIPFAAVAMVATLATAMLVLLAVSEVFESRIQTQILNTSRVISRGGFSSNVAVLRSVKAITGAEVVTFDENGAVLATTLEPAHARLQAQVVAGPGGREAGRAPGVHEMDCEDAPCYVAYRAVSDRPGAMVAVVVETAEAAAATRAVARTVLVGAVASLAVMILVSQVVARRVTSPIDRLVAFTQDITTGAGQGRAEEGSDDVGRLGRAFNAMLDRLESSQRKLVQSEKVALAGLMAARVAHDIRNPMASIKINTQMLAARVRGDGKNADLVSAVLTDVDQVESVIRDLIELARPGELSRVGANLNEVVREVLRHLHTRLAHRKIAVHEMLMDDLPAASIDVERFKQVLVNLIVNAADAMPNGGAVAVATAVGPEPGTLVIDVIDEGTGIHPSVRERVFDPFVSTKPDGVGLGLVNVKAVVEQHGGRVELTPRSPRGTCARITLPV